ncbi:MAG: ABC transporter permease [Gallicola sp.]|nr:ABC transporter permease [Gallicola sp.]
MFKDIFLSQIKIVFRNKTGLFWNFLFPFVLGTLFFFAFRNILEVETFTLDPIPVAYVEDANSTEVESFRSFLEEIGVEAEIKEDKIVDKKKSDDPFFQYIPTEQKQAEEWMTEGLVYGTIIKGSDTEFLLSPSETRDFKVSIVEAILNQYEQNYKVITEITAAKMQGGNMDPSFPQKSMDILFSGNEDSIKDITSSKLNSPYIILFFSLMGYSAMLAMSSGIHFVSGQLEADLSDIALRQAISPISKHKRFFAGAIPRLMVQMSASALLFLYLRILGISFGDQTAGILLITEIGCICGFFMGTGIATTFRKSKSALLGLGVGIPLLLAALSGMMSHQVKYYVAKHAPWLQQINLINRITDGIYSLYYYEGLERYTENLTAILLITAIFFGVTLINLRRTEYEGL